MILNLKEAAMFAGLIFNPKVIAVDFEATAIAAFGLHFLNAKIIGCHFHFLTAMYKKLVELVIQSLNVGLDCLCLCHFFVLLKLMRHMKN